MPAGDRVVRPIDPRLLRRAGAARTLLAVTVVLGVVVAAAVVAQAWLLATAIARAIDGAPGGVPGGDGAVQAHGSITSLVVALAGVVLLRAAASWAQAVASRRAAAAVKSTLRRQLVRRFARVGDDHATRTRRSDAAATTIDGLDALDPWFADYLPQLVLACIIPVVVVAQLALVDTTTALTVVLTLPLIPVFMVLVGRMTEASNRSRWRALQRLSHHFLDVVEGMPTLRAFRRGDAQADLVRASTDRYRTTTMRTLRIAFLSSLVLELLATLSVALVAVGVGLRLVHGDLDLRTGLFLIVIAPEAYLPLRQVGAQYHASAAGVAAAESVFAALADDGDGSGATGTATTAPGVRAAAMPELDGRFEVHLDGITVHHVGRERAAPHHADVLLRSGEIVGVAGGSGVGKSTLVAALLGHRRPDEGEVRVHAAGGTVSLADVPNEHWWRQVAWVDQQPFVRAGTVEDNLRLGRADADVVELRAVLDRVGLPLALDREVGERGSELSAGERRRLVLARALLRGAPVLVLDEVTAGLDADSEDAVVRAVRDEADRGAAVLLVAHRPGALAAADRVVTLS